MLNRAKVDLAGTTGTQIPSMRLFSQTRVAALTSEDPVTYTPDNLLAGVIKRSQSAPIEDVLPSTRELFAACPTMVLGDSFDFKLVASVEEITVEVDLPGWTGSGFVIPPGGCAFITCTAASDNNQGGTGTCSKVDASEVLSNVSSDLLRKVTPGMTLLISGGGGGVVMGTDIDEGTITLSSAVSGTAGDVTIDVYPTMNIDVWHIAAVAV